MKITPIEIRQHTFEKGLRGYRTDEVDAFLSSLSQEWERVVGEQKMLKMQLELAEKELNKLKEVELTLFKTLKTAEDTSSQITDQATKAAEQHLAEARRKADDMLADAKKKSSMMIQDAQNQARYLKDNILNDLKAMEHDFKAMERYKDTLVAQIKTLSANAMDSVDRFEKKFAKQSFKGKIDEVATQIKEEQREAEKQAQAAQPQLAAAGLAAETGTPTATPETGRDAIAEVADMPTGDELVEPPTSRGPEVDPSAELVQQVDEAVQITTAEVMPEPTPQPESQPAEPKQGGSFFDQI
ncbi:DivIVA domain-containing protein [Rudanella paleaurantiibacter]|uniref:DivIVA domain-containing protein n=1 Tax=Rudanella paleaurantiibacter TaxID=2614655 RepID=A0A7J5TX89_9BACT|nr:DivIVA domain-containing protein [Rudanella paleaurantiibacter]KAB7729258.1 DivIVA domain-containing protein [Rudanella paleaurantiibacter]